jgi:hypothetical protein
LKRCNKWLDAAVSKKKGTYGYTERTNGSISTDAIGLYSREFLSGWKQDAPELVAGVKRVTTVGPQPTDLYFSYFATQVLFEYGGKDWSDWNEKMRDGIIAAQDGGQDGLHAHHKGSWHHASSHAGRIMDTSLAILTLEAYYRYEPINPREKKK